MELPNEIIPLILKSLEKHDLKSARLVSKTWTSLAAEFLFDQVYVSAHPENLEVFGAIARHPLLSGCIKTLIYDAVDFVEICTKKQYIGSLWVQTSHYFNLYNREQLEAFNFGPDINTWLKAVVRAYSDVDSSTFRRVQERLGSGWETFKDYDFINQGYQKFLKCAALQRAQFDNGAFLESLVGGLQTLKNLSCVMVDGPWSFLYDLFPEPDFFPDPKKPFLEKPTGSPLARDWNIFHTCPRAWNFEPPQYFFMPQICGAENGADHYCTIIAALLRSQRKIQTFKTGDQSRCKFPPFVFDRTRKESLSFYGLDLVAFSELQVLKLSVAQYGHENTPELFPNIDGLRFLLRSVRHLRDLDLDLPEGSSHRPVFYKFSQVFPQEGQWNHLTSLSLYAISSSAADLLTLITRKMPALSHLQLAMIGLDIGDWEGVIECMKQSMHLSSFRISPVPQLYHRGGYEFFDYEMPGLRSGEIEDYVQEGGRHPCLRPDQSDAAAILYITPDIQDFYKPTPTHTSLAS